MSITLSFILQPLAFAGVPPISSRGNVNEIMSPFDGGDQLRSTMKQI